MPVRGGTSRTSPARGETIFVWSLTSPERSAFDRRRAFGTGGLERGAGLGHFGTHGFEGTRASQPLICEAFGAFERSTCALCGSFGLRDTGAGHLRFRLCDQIRDLGRDFVEPCEELTLLHLVARLDEDLNELTLDWRRHLYLVGQRDAGCDSNLFHDRSLGHSRSSVWARFGPASQEIRRGQGDDDEHRDDERGHPAARGVDPRYLELLVHRCLTVRHVYRTTRPSSPITPAPTDTGPHRR